MIDAGVSRSEMPHVTGCACCVPRSEVAATLAQLFLRRARGEIAFFRRVVVAEADPAAADSVRAALQSDPLLAARFRLG